jgi:RNA polymerase sigma-70 factor (ECF subfamily)
MQLERQRSARAAASRIWHVHRVYLYSLSLRWLGGDRVEAEDAVADVVYKASLALSNGGADIINERAWLARVLRNRCMDSHRRRTAAPLAPHRQAADDEDPDIADTNPSAEDLLLNRELGRVLGEALAELPDMLRGPVTMRLVHEETYSSISEAYMITEANARKRIQQARELLRQRLRNYLYGDNAPRGRAKRPVRPTGPESTDPA